MRKKFKFNRVLAVVLVLESKGLYSLLRRLPPRVNSLRWVSWNCCHSLRSRRLEVVSEGENGCARGRHATHFLREKPWEVDAKGEGATSPLACLLLARPFFLLPTTSKHLLRRLLLSRKFSYSAKIVLKPRSSSVECSVQLSVTPWAEITWPLIFLTSLI